MKISCLQENLNKTLKSVLPVVPGRSTLPILSNILMSAEGGRLKIAATNLETAVTKWMGCKTETEGAVTVPAQLFASIISAMPPGLISLSLEGATLKVACDGSRASLQTITAKDYPPIPQASGESFELSPEILSEAISKTIMCADTADTRPVLSGINLKAKDGVLAFAAADGFSLAVYRTPCQGEFDVIVPGKTMSYLQKSLNQEEMVSVRIGKGGMAFGLKDTEIYSGLINGSFPRYESLIPQEFTTNVVIDIEQFLQAVRAASNLDNIIRLIANNTMTVLASKEQIGEYEQSIPAEIKGNEIKIAFATKYLNNLSLFEGKVTMSTNNSSSPAVFTNSGNYLYEAMPCFWKWD